MKHQASNGNGIDAIVGSVFRERDKRYVIAYPTSDGHGLTKQTSVSFSFSAWPGNEHLPKPGQRVSLHNLSQFAKGWRASQAYPIKPQSGSSTTSMEQR